MIIGWVGVGVLGQTPGCVQARLARMRLATAAKGKRSQVRDR
jgi:hypothetical protein